MVTYRHFCFHAFDTTWIVLEALSGCWGCRWNAVGASLAAFGAAVVSCRYLCLDAFDDFQSHMTLNSGVYLTACRPFSKLQNTSCLFQGTMSKPYDAKLLTYKRLQPTDWRQVCIPRSLVAPCRVTACSVTSLNRNKITASILQHTLTTSLMLFWKFVINTKQQGRKPIRRAQYRAPTLQTGGCRTENRTAGNILGFSEHLKIKTLNYSRQKWRKRQNQCSWVPFNLYDGKIMCLLFRRRFLRQRNKINDCGSSVRQKVKFFCFCLHSPSNLKLYLMPAHSHGKRRMMVVFCAIATLTNLDVSREASLVPVRLAVFAPCCEDESRTR